MAARVSGDCFWRRVFRSRQCPLMVALAIGLLLLPPLLLQEARADDCTTICNNNYNTQAQNCYSAQVTANQNCSNTYNNVDIPFCDNIFPICAGGASAALALALAYCSATCVLPPACAICANVALAGYAIALTVCGLNSINCYQKAQAAYSQCLASAQNIRNQCDAANTNTWNTCMANCGSGGN